MKTRYAKPFESVQVKIPYETGMDPYSGLIDLFEKQGLLVKTGNRLQYIRPNGDIMLEYRKAWTGEKLNVIMSDVANNSQMIINSAETDEEAVDNQEPENEGNTDS